MENRQNKQPVVYTLAFSVLFVVLLLGLVKVFNFDHQVLDFLEWVRSAGYTGRSIFFLAVALTVVLLLPSALFTLAAGYLYGIVGGVILIVFAETLGAYIAFMIARKLQYHPLLNLLRKRTIFQKFGDSVAMYSWRMIALIRMLPFFPFKLSNYFFGLTGINQRQYFVGTLLGLWPISAFNVYLGSLAGDLMSLDSAALQRSPLQWAAYLFGFLVVIILVIVAARVAGRKFQE